MAQELENIPTSRRAIYQREPIPAKGKSRDRALARLWALGYSIEELSKIFGLTFKTVKTVIQKKEVKAYVNEFVEEHESRFNNLLGKTVDVIDDALCSSDPQIALAGASLWLRASGRMNQKISEERLTAEDVVRQLLSQSNTEMVGK